MVTRFPDVINKQYKLLQNAEIFLVTGYTCKTTINSTKAIYVSSILVF
jgi:hypothetical protein